MPAARKLTLVLAAVMAVQAASGLLFPNQYRDPDWIEAAWYGNDWITLVLAAPLLIVGVVGAERGSRRGELIWLGLLAYAAYNYAFYLFGAALNAFFLLYVCSSVLAVTALIVALSRLDVAGLAAGFGSRVPARIIGGSLTLIGLTLGAVWIVMWAAYVYAGRATPVEPEAFKVVAALDLALMVPALTVGGVLLWRRIAWGYVIATIASVQGALYLLVLSVSSVVGIRRGLVAAPGELPIWGTLLVVTAALAGMLLGSVRRR
jgi:hypothetical protein